MCLMPPMEPAAEDSRIAFASSAPTTVAEGRISSKYRGLCWDKKHHAWRVRIFYCGKQRHVGRYRDDVTAARAYDKAAVYLYGTKAILNFTMEDCMKDPSAVSGFITLAKEQARQQKQQQQQQQTYLTSSLRDGSLLQCNSSCSSQTVGETDVNQQMSLLGVQRVTSPANCAIQQQQYFLQQTNKLQPIPSPVLQQLQPQAAYQATHLESSMRMLRLQQQQQHGFTTIGPSLVPHQQLLEQSAVYGSSNSSNCSMAATLNTTSLPLQSIGFPASSSAAVGFMGAGSLFSSSSSSSKNGATVLIAPSLDGISRTMCLGGQGQMLDMGGTNASGTTTMEYITLQDGQQLLLPALAAAKNAANSLLLHGHQNAFTNTGSRPQLQTPTVTAQQQQQCYSPCSNSSSSIVAQSPVVAGPQQVAYTAPQQQLRAVPSSSSMAAVGSSQLTLNALQQQHQGSPMQLPISVAVSSSSSSSDAAALLSLIQNCSISQQWV